MRIREYAVTFVTKSAKNPHQPIRNTMLLRSQDFALYQDATNGAAISVTTTKAGSGRHARHLVSVK